MSDKIRPTEAELSSIASGASDLYHNVMSHESTVWNNVTVGQASVAQYAEAGAEALAALAIGRFGLRALSRESAASGELNLFQRETSAGRNSATVLDLEKYKYRFAGPTASATLEGQAETGMKLPMTTGKVIEMAPIRRQGFLGRNSNSLDHVVPKDFREKTSTQAPSLDALTGELKF